MQEEFEYDFFVIGGGSGGLAAVKEAANLGAKAAVADFVKPSPIGTKWGLGGTCVNVGCIPKKLMHTAALWGEQQESHVNAGWQIEAKNKHNWSELVSRVQMHIKKLNFGHRSECMKKGVKYYNALGKIVGPNKVSLTNAKGEVTEVTAKYILIAVGGRPTFLEDIPNIGKLTITSDDIFSMKKNPGKVLIVGASYIALECAGFLHGLGYDVTVMVRSIFLRGFDQQIANLIGQFMERRGLKFIKGAIPNNVVATEDGRRNVTWIDAKTEQQIGFDTFDTVMLAIGRSADTNNLGLEAVGIKTASNGKILANDDDTTNAQGVYAIGDCVSGRLELTPTAIMAGKLLVRRLFANQTRLMNYLNVATTVFTPIEYGCIGYSEEDAIKQFGEQNIQVYQGLNHPLEWTFTDEREGENGYIKLVINKQLNGKVIGFHYLGLHAGEVTQGFSVAINIGCTIDDIKNTVGIHPTYAEEVVKLWQVKGQGELEEAGC